MEDILNLIAAEADVPRLTEYFGLWSILKEPFQSAVAKASAIDLQTHITANQRAGFSADTGDCGFVYRDGDIAVIGIVGSMMKGGSSLGGVTSSIRTRRRIRAAAADEQVRAIIIKIDSPGGTVAGIFDLVDDVAAAAKQKPVTAYIEDLGASAAYAVASQASKIYANKTALIGSIGIYGVIVDQSKRAEKMRVVVHVLRAGKFKGAGTAGTEITQEQLDEWQRIVNELNEHFLTAVARGRHRDSGWAKGVADGRVHVGEAAVKLGLIDGIRTFDGVLHELQKQSKGQQPQQQQTQTLPAVNQAGVNQGISEPVQVVPATTLPSKEKEAPTVPTQEETDRAVINQFNNAIEEKRKGGMDRRRAVAIVARGNPKLHRAYLIATNRDRPGAISQLV